MPKEISRKTAQISVSGEARGGRLSAVICKYHPFNGFFTDRAPQCVPIRAAAERNRWSGWTALCLPHPTEVGC